MINTIITFLAIIIIFNTKQKLNNKMSFLYPMIPDFEGSIK